MLKTPRHLLVVFSVLAATLLTMSAAFACTLLVGPTQQLTPAAGEGEEIKAYGQVVQRIEDQSPQCPDDGCTYDYVVVDPDVFPAESDTGPAGTPSCHYNKSEYGIADGDVKHKDGAVKWLEGEGPVPRQNADGSENGDGLTVTCFVSEEPNQATGDGRGPATATQPAPFYKTD